MLDALEEDLGPGEGGEVATARVQMPEQRVNASTQIPPSAFNRSECRRY